MATRTREVVVSNKAQCKLCNDVIESKSGHDFKYCSCGEIFVDGGNEYLRRGAKNFDNFIELSEIEEIVEDSANE
jgi:hypothetical protein